MRYERGDNVQLSKHFHLREFECKCGKCVDQYVHMELVRLLEYLRVFFGKPITITSAYRCTKHNKKIGGVPASRHIFGFAADIKVLGITPSEVTKEAVKLFGGVGTYRTFTHVDVREKSTHWKGKY